MTLKIRLQRLETNRAQFSRWIPPIIEFDPTIPGDEESKAAAAKAAALAAGWRPADGLFVVLVGLASDK